MDIISTFIFSVSLGLMFWSSSAIVFSPAFDGKDPYHAIFRSLTISISNIVLIIEAIIFE